MPRPDRSKIPIMDAALAEISIQGVAGIRIDTIAGSAGLNKRMIYHHYGDKEGLVCAALGTALNQLDLPDDMAVEIQQALKASHAAMDSDQIVEGLQLSQADAARIVMAELLRTPESGAVLLADPCLHRVRTLMQIVMGRAAKPRLRIAAESRNVAPPGL